MKIVEREVIWIIATTHAGASRAPLGYGIIDIAPVEEFREEIMSTPGWENVNAIKNDRVYFISTAASSVHHCCFLLYMAKCFYELFEDVDPDEVLNEWFERFLGIEKEGIYAYPLP